MQACVVTCTVVPSEQASKRKRKRGNDGCVGMGVDNVPFLLALRILVFAHQCTCGIKFACASVKV